MATFTIKSLIVALSAAVAGVMIPSIAFAGPALTQANAPVEMWDVVAPRAEVKTVVSHMDIQQGQGFDARGTVIPMNVEILTRAQFEGAVHATEMWDAVPADNGPKALGVSHMDIQPGQGFDAPARKTAQVPATYLVASYRSPDA